MDALSEIISVPLVLYNFSLNGNVMDVPKITPVALSAGEKELEREGASRSMILVTTFSENSFRWRPGYVCSNLFLSLAQRCQCFW